MKKIISILLITVLLLTVFIVPAYAKEGTEGDELQVVQPEQLEIQLGPSLAGAQFSLETDAGIYPGVVVADEHGVLKLEIGGSSSYVLMRLDLSVPAPLQESTIDETAVPTPADPEEVTEPAEGETAEPVTPSQPDNAIPTQHIILFAGGAVLCIGFLIASYFFKRRKERRYQDDDE